MKHRHVEDAVLVRLVDGEPVDDEVKRDVRGCDRCAERARRLAARTGGLDRALNALEVRPPSWDRDFLDAIGRSDERTGAGRRGGPILRWAAAIVVLIAAAAAPSTARLVEGVAAWWNEFVGGGPPEAASPGAAETGTATVGTRVEGPLLRVVLETSDAPGIVTFRRHGAGEASATLTSSSNAAELLVRADGFAVRGVTVADTLEIGVPAEVREVEVRRGERVLGRHQLPVDSGAVWILPRERD